MNPKLSVVLATFNEEENIKRCLDSVNNIASEIIIVDGSSSDRTREISKDLGAKVIKTENHPNFHINKRKAIDLAKGDWILQLDADETVSPELAREIIKVMSFNETSAQNYQETLKQKELFLRHKKIVEKRDGAIGDNSKNYSAYFLPRLNFFLGGYLKYGGVYPDGVIRLFKKGYANLPAKDVHEQMVVEGKVGWLQNPLYHMDSPTFSRYLKRNSRYINLIKDELKRNKTPKNIAKSIEYLLIKPLHWFFLTAIRHKGILDGLRGIIFSFFSALRFPRAYIRYIQNK